MDLTIVTLKSKPAIAIRDTCTAAKLPDKFNEIYTEIEELMSKQSLSVGYPFGIYHEYSPEKIDLEAGILADKIPVLEGRIKQTSTYGGKAAKTVFVGPYEKLHEAWGEFAKLVDAEGHKLSGPCFELYITNPAEEPDSSKWVTELYTPIK